MSAEKGGLAGSLDTARLISIQVGQPRMYGRAEADDPHDRTWTTSFCKAPIAGSVFVGPTNVEGDRQADLKFHGGPDKAVLAYSADHYPTWREELSLAELPYGAFGENLSLAGLNESQVCIGDTWQIGDVVLQVTQPRQPCWKLARRWRITDLAARVVQNGKCGWYLRVLATGLIEAGLDVRLISRPHPEWTITRASHLMYHDKRNASAALELAGLSELSASWQEELTARASQAREH